VPSLDVSTTLIRLKRLGADPKILSTRSSAVAALPQLFPELLAGNFALVIVTADLCATAFFIDNQMKTLREFSLPPDARSTDILSDICREIRCSIAKVEKETNQRINRCYLSGPKDLIAPFSRELDRSIELVDFASAVNIDPSVNLNGYDITWAIGLFANELSKLQKTRTPVVNFRRGAFAYKPTWGNILNALKDEIFYVGLAAFLGVVWCGTIIFTSYSALNRVESAIGSELSSSLPGMSITKRQEVTILRSKVTDLEEQLKGIGSLSALSPLESLKELSQAIGPEIDIKLEAINVSHDGLSFRGSVLDFPSVGRLTTALESRTGRFCKVKVDSKGTAPGSPRVKFQADITFCQ